jgi:hypothetical protein
VVYDRLDLSFSESSYRSIFRFPKLRLIVDASCGLHGTNSSSLICGFSYWDLYRVLRSGTLRDMFFTFSNGAPMTQTFKLLQSCFFGDANSGLTPDLVLLMLDD